MIETMLARLIAELISTHAKANEVDTKIIAAIIVQESVLAGSTLADAICAVRYEDDYFNRYISGQPLAGFIPRGVSSETERRGRATSWGLMQIMGGTAREAGFTGRYFPQLCLPWENIAIGAKYFADCVKWAQGDLFLALRKYNGNPKIEQTKHYAEKVLDHIKLNRIKVFGL